MPTPTKLLVASMKRVVASKVVFPATFKVESMETAPLVFKVPVTEVLPVIERLPGILTVEPARVMAVVPFRSLMVLVWKAPAMSKVVTESKVRVPAL